MDEAGRRLLIAEDDAEVGDLLAHLLAGAGLSVEVVHDGFAALTAIDRSRPDLLLLDLRLPDLDGWAVLRWLGRSPLPPPVLAVSAVADYDTACGVLKAGAVGFLPKPFAMRHLLAACRSALRFVPLDRVRGAERRVQPRRGTVLPARVSSPRGVHKALLTDLNAGGGCLEAFDEVETGDGVEVRFDLPRGPALEAEVRWRRSTAHGFSCGVAFRAVREDLEHDLGALGRAPVLGLP